MPNVHNLKYFIDILSQKKTPRIRSLFVFANGFYSFLASSDGMISTINTAVMISSPPTASCQVNKSLPIRTEISAPMGLSHTMMRDVSLLLRCFCA